MTPPLTYFVGQRDPSVSDNLTVDDAPYDLTGKTVRFKMRLRDSSTLAVDQPATVTSAATGGVRYDWDAADVDTAGEYVAWWEVTAGGKVQDTFEFPVVIRTHGPVEPGLCSVEDVRDYLDLGASDRDKDTLIESLIRRATRAIERWTDRQLLPTTAETRRFAIDPRMVAAGGRINLSLAPYELRSATSVELHPESGSPVVLVADTDYILSPYGGLTYGATYNTLGLAPALGYASTYSGLFGDVLVDVTGDWGVSPIPEDLQHACIVTVGIWMRRDVQAFSSTFSIDEDRVERPEAIPSSVRGLLGPWRRVTV